MNGLGRGDAEEGDLGASRKWAVGSERLLREVYREEIDKTIESGGGNSDVGSEEEDETSKCLVSGCDCPADLGQAVNHHFPGAEA